MIYQTLPAHRLEPVRSIVQSAIDELGFENETDTAYVLGSMAGTLMAKTGVVFVDNPNDVGTVVWIVFTKSLFLNKSICVNPLIYTKPALRGDWERVKNIVESIESASKFHGIEKVFGGEWNLTGTRSSGKMWEKAGYRKVETYFVKDLQ